MILIADRDRMESEWGPTEFGKWAVVETENGSRPLMGPITRGRKAQASCLELEGNGLKWNAAHSCRPGFTRTNRHGECQRPGRDDFTST